MHGAAVVVTPPDGQGQDHQREEPNDDVPDRRAAAREELADPLFARAQQRARNPHEEGEDPVVPLIEGRASPRPCFMAWMIAFFAWPENLRPAARHMPAASW